MPRSQLAEFLKLPEAQQVGVYFLLGELAEAGLPRVYIGQSGSVGTRLVQHNQSKDFWNRALVVISLTNSLTQTHALFLAWCYFRGDPSRALLTEQARHYACYVASIHLTAIQDSGSP